LVDEFAQKSGNIDFFSGTLLGPEAAVAKAICNFTWTDKKVRVFGLNLFELINYLIKQRSKIKDRS